MINWLRVAKSAYFYRKKRRLPKNAIVELFRALRQNSETPSNSIFHHVKQLFAGTSWSAIAFFHERNPSFLELPPGYVRPFDFLKNRWSRSCVRRIRPRWPR